MNDDGKMTAFFEEYAALRRGWVQERKLELEVTTPCGLTPARYEALDALLDSSDPVDSQVALQKKLGVGSTSVSRPVRDLVKLGLVVRVPNRDDRRKVRLAATKEGRARYAKAKKRFDSADIGARCGLILAAMNGLPVGGGPTIARAPAAGSASRPIVHRPLFGTRRVTTTLS
jgi:DNA-binding MarR family transcriptional regulator